MFYMIEAEKILINVERAMDSLGKALEGQGRKDVEVVVSALQTEVGRARDGYSRYINELESRLGKTRI